MPIAVRVGYFTWRTVNAKLSSFAFEAIEDMVDFNFTGGAFQLRVAISRILPGPCLALKRFAGCFIWRPVIAQEYFMKILITNWLR